MLDRKLNVLNQEGDDMRCWQISKKIVGSVVVMLAFGMASQANAANWFQVSSNTIARGSSKPLARVDTHVCMLTGVRQLGKTSGDVYPQIRNIEGAWTLFRGSSNDDPIVDATCYPHTDFYARTGGVGVKSYGNSSIGLHATTNLGNFCQDGQSYDFGDPTGVVYMLGVGGDFYDTGLLPLDYNSHVAINQADTLYLPTFPLLTRAKSRVQLHIDGCTAAVNALDILFPFLVVGDVSLNGHFHAGWYRNGSSPQMAKFMTQDRQRVFAVNPNSEFHAEVYDAIDHRSVDIPMARSFESACYLTYLEGDFSTGSGQAYIYDKNGQWTLHAQTTGDNPIKASARCYAYDQSTLYEGPGPF
jgi:hypothetical protein